MMLLLRILLPTIIVLLHVPLANATNGMKIIGIGQVQRAMGGANIALPLDAACTITNPAGLRAAGKRIDLGLTYFVPDVSYRASGAVAYQNAEITSNSPLIFIPALGYIYPLSKSITLGIGLYGTSGMGVDYDMNLYGNITETKYAFMKLAPAVSYTFNNGLSIGFSPNIDYALMDFEAGSPDQVAHEDGKAIGLGYTLGVHYPLSEHFNLGLAYESKQYFEDFKFDVDSGEDKLQFHQPQNLAAGIAYMPSSSLRFAFDLVWIDWPQSNGKNKPVYTENASGAIAWNLDWNEQFVYKFGLEYDLNQKITLRAGYNYGKNPLEPERAFENLAFPAVTEQHFTLGGAYGLDDNWRLNFGLMYSPTSAVDTANFTEQYIASANTEMKQYSLDFGFSYSF
ncbi:MAG: outer membrane protein transport protein [Desulfocapsa sp.]|nr:outer membrane protein transport protein [Desulfocapsa sp.]